MTKILLVVYLRLLAWAQAPHDVDEKKNDKKKMHCRRAAKKEKKEVKINKTKYLLCCLFASSLTPPSPGHLSGIYNAERYIWD